MTTKQREVLEFVQSTGPHKVDRDAGVIRDVKILGHTSANGHTYARKAITEGRALYDGTSVFVDHPARARADEERKMSDQFGWLESVQEKPDGLYGDLHFIKSHPMAGVACEIAERRPDKMGLSHNAVVSESVQGGKSVFEAIHRVRSVDLVCRPATTRGIFESVEEPPVKKTVRQVLESHSATLPRAARLRKVLEEEGMPPMADVPVEAPAAASAEDEVSSAFKAMVNAVLDDGSLDLAGKKKKIGDILAAQEKLTAKVEEAPASEAPASETPAETSESRKEKKNAYEKAIDILEAAGIKSPTGAQLKVVAALDGQQEHQRSVVESWKPTGPGGAKPRSVARNALESQGDADTKTNEADRKRQFDAAFDRVLG